MTMASAICLSACASRQNTTTAATEEPKQSFTSKLKKFSFVKLPKFRMPGPFFEPDIKIVEPREKDLKKLPSGSELAQAYRKKQRGIFWIVGGPVNFKEPDLPTPGIDMGEDLLPPLPQ
jgi:hypothetical protein